MLSFPPTRPLKMSWLISLLPISITISSVHGRPSMFPTRVSQTLTPALLKLSRMLFPFKIVLPYKKSDGLITVDSCSSTRTLSPF
ncbi:hypothetical protein KP509_27G026800 [Ceratopteris richardii]|uniref:Secreted protein n=1 Tax=Ceratopteris richardii TaxID=49495 RepID=A0A8T2RG87_CERRI|nr:hypothetical protein KP509_27G026800 [Ceratopteris richardii]